MLDLTDPDRAALVAMLERGEEPAVLARLTTRLAADAHDTTANLLLALIHGSRDDHDAALAHAAAALDGPRTPAPADAAMLHRVRGNILMVRRAHADALDAFEASIHARPEQPDMQVAAARCEISLNRFEAAVRRFEAALARFPDAQDVVTGYASTLFNIGRPREVVALVDRCIARFPECTELHEIRCFSRNFLDGVDPLAHREEHRALAARYEAAYPRPPFPIAPARDPKKRLRVGFISGDFAEHACAYFLQAPILSMDRRGFTPVCISTLRHQRGQDRFRAACEWLDVAEQHPDAIAHTLASANLDIAIDCAGFSGGHVLGSLVPRIAHIQLTWLGYPNTTGLSSMDGRIVDAVTDPSPAADAHATERLVRLPGCFLCYTPPTDSPPTPVRDATRPITFGSFNRTSKLGDRAIRAWARVLTAVPDARLLVKEGARSDELRERTRATFAHAGVDPARIDLSDWITDVREHLRLYERLDIGLDAFPYNGTTTTFEACWMGVPVVTLAGETHRARVGASINAALGLDDLVARDDDDFVAIATALARDRARLATLQASLRDRMRGPTAHELTGKPRALVLCDPAAYARKFEAALRALWVQACAPPRA